MLLQTKEQADRLSIRDYIIMSVTATLFTAAIVYITPPVTEALIMSGTLLVILVVLCLLIVSLVRGVN